ncbi:MAG TPA: plastocyanin/azurin family copper-binding protein [Gemmatimonadaceae bacterium]
MRFFRLALVASAVVIGACSGGENKTTDTAASAATTPAPAPTADTSAKAAAPAPGAATGTATAQPATGQTVEVKMIGDAKGYRFEPKDITIKQGDALKFVMVTGGPHNVAFDPATVPANAKAQLSANMPGQISELSSPMLMNPNEAYTISFAGVPAGKYPFHCTPHLAMGMTGTVTVQ